jgi:hypothetical protein
MSSITSAASSGLRRLSNRNRFSSVSLEMALAVSDGLSVFRNLIKSALFSMAIKSLSISQLGAKFFIFNLRKF